MLKHKDRIPKMGRNARNYAEQELNADVYYGQLMKIYQKAAEKVLQGKSKYSFASMQIHLS